MVLVAAAAAGLMGAGLIGVSQFASADRPEVTPSTAGETLAAPTPDTTAPTGDDGGGDDGDRNENGEGGPIVDGQIVIDNGDGEPIVIDLGEGTIDGESLSQFSECVGLPMLGDGPMLDFEAGEFPFGEFPFEDFEGMLEDFPFEDFEGMLEDFSFDEFGDFGGFGGDGTHVTVMGPDGLTVIELGDGDGSVTITQQGGETTIDTDGSATVSELDEMLGAIELPDLESLDIEQLLEDFPFDRFDDFAPEDFEGFEFELPLEIQDCLAAIDNG